MTLTVRRASNLAFTAAALLLLSAEGAFAQGSGGTGTLTSFINNIVTQLTGPLGQAVAILAICGAGLAWMFGGIAFRTMGGAIAGIAIVFSSAWIVSTLIA